MADITKCVNKECTKKQNCYRFTVPPNEPNQSYQEFEFMIIKGVHNCDYFISNLDDNSNKKLKTP